MWYEVVLENYNSEEKETDENRQVFALRRLALLQTCSFAGVQT